MKAPISRRRPGAGPTRPRFALMDKLLPAPPVTPSLLGMLGFISTEIHKGFKPFFKADATDADRQAAREQIGKRLSFLADQITSDFVLGDLMSVARSLMRWKLEMTRGRD